MRNLTLAEIAQISGALYGELLFATLVVSMGFLGYRSWGNNPTAHSEGAMAFLTQQGHCA